VIEHRIMGDPGDVALLVRALPRAARMIETSKLSPLLSGLNNPAEIPRDNAGREDALRSYTSIGFYPVGTGSWSPTTLRS
jgi:hypothetical protein